MSKRSQLCNVFPDYMIAMHEIFDRTVTESYQIAVDSGFEKGEWLLQNDKVVSLFIGGNDVRLMETFDKDHVKDDDYDLLQRVLNTSLIAKTLFAAEAVSLNYLQFVKNIHQQLEVLENLSYAAEDVSNFKKVMALEVQRMIDSGAGSYEKDEISIMYLTKHSRVVLADLNDQWFWRLNARIKQIEINTRSVPLLPYEAVLFAEGSLKGVPTQIKLDSVLQERHASFRRQLLLDFKKKECITLKSMIDVVLANIKIYKQIDRTCDIDVSFLTDHAEDLIREKAYKMLVDLFPSHTSDIPFATVLRTLNEVKTLPEILHLGDTLFPDINGLISITSSLIDGEGPSPQRFESFGPLIQLCLKRLETTFELRVPGTKGTTVLHGREAIQKKFQMMKIEFDEGKRVSPDAVRFFRKFAWVLTVDEAKLVATWLTQSLRDHVTHLSCITDKKRTLDDGEAISDPSCTEDASNCKALVPLQLGEAKRKTSKVTCSEQLMSATVSASSAPGVSRKALAKKNKEQGVQSTLLNKFFKSNAKVT